MCGSSSALYSLTLIRCGSICFSLFRIPIILEHLLITLSECFFSNLDSSPKLIREIEIAQLLSKLVLFILVTTALAFLE